MKINDTIYYVFNEFDGCGCIKCKIKEIFEDHILIEDDEHIVYWIFMEDVGKSTRNHPIKFEKRTTLVAQEKYFEM